MTLGGTKHFLPVIAGIVTKMLVTFKNNLVTNTFFRFTVFDKNNHRLVTYYRCANCKYYLTVRLFGLAVLTVGGCKLADLQCRTPFPRNQSGCSHLGTDTGWAVGFRDRGSP